MCAPPRIRDTPPPCGAFVLSKSPQIEFRPPKIFSPDLRDLSTSPIDILEGDNASNPIPPVASNMSVGLLERPPIQRDDIAHKPKIERGLFETPPKAAPFPEITPPKGGNIVW